MNLAQKKETFSTNDLPILTKADLPAPSTKRWVASRKAQVVYAVQNGIISLTDACERYALSVEEFLGWQRSIERNGIAGLRTTRLQHYRADALRD